MVVELIADVLAVADLAKDLDLGALHLDVVIQLGPRHMLVLIQIADVATKLRAVILCMSLQLPQSLPNDLALAPSGHASMRKLTKVNAISEYLIHLLHVVALSLAVRTARFVIRARGLIHLLLRLSAAAISASRHHVVVNFLANISERYWCVRNLLQICHLLATLTQLQLAVFAE